MASDVNTELTVNLRPDNTLLRGIWAFSRTYPIGAIGGGILLLLVLLAIFAPIVATDSPLAEDIPNRLHPPDLPDFIFGTDYLGRDTYSRVIYGARVSLYVGLMSVAIGSIVGTLIGVISAYAGGKADLILQRVIDGMMGIPALVMTLAMVVALGASANNVVLAIAVAFTPRMARLARSEALSVKQEDFVLAARTIGARPLRVVLRHVLPNSLTSVIVLAAGYLGTAIVIEAALSFLGLGVPPPDPTWGGMLRFAARRYMEEAPWLTIFPGLVLAITVFSFNLFGDALRDHLDPRLRNR